MFSVSLLWVFFRFPDLVHSVTPLFVKWGGVKRQEGFSELGMLQAWLPQALAHEGTVLKDPLLQKWP